MFNICHLIVHIKSLLLQIKSKEFSKSASIHSPYYNINYKPKVGTLARPEKWSKVVESGRKWLSRVILDNRLK